LNLLKASVEQGVEKFVYVFSASVYKNLHSCMLNYVVKVIYIVLKRAEKLIM